MTDAYQNNSSSFQGSGTTQISSSSTQSYNSQATENQIYSSGTLTSDTLTYSNGSGGSSSMTVSNSDSYTATTPRALPKARISRSAAAEANRRTTLPAVSTF
jgi:hypothetical protein